MTPLQLSSAAASLPLPHTYLYLGVLLYLTGIGVPIPEEITLILAGAAVYGGGLHYWPAFLVSIVGVIAGDIQVYLIGRYLGRWLLAKKFFHFLMPPDRLERAEKRFAGHFVWAIATVRFLSGLRGATYFSAGTLRMPFLKFLLTDLAAACVHVVLYTSLGYFFSPQVDRVIAFVKRADKWVGIAIVMGIALLALTIGYRLGRRPKKTPL